MSTSLRWYLSYVANKTRWIVDEGAEPPWDPDRGLIALTWHGRQFLGHVALRSHPKPGLLAASHRDGRIIGLAAAHAGFKVVTGSGATTAADAKRKGGSRAFRAMLAELKQERAMLMTADVPKRAGIAGIGAAKLAQISGVPIHCFAALTDKRVELNNWDRTHVVLPFGRGAVLWSPPIEVAASASKADLEFARLEIETTLHRLHHKAADAISSQREPWQIAR
jgi:lysophospholipid acyltransferase (LPLAT)-like uncharacterized protein